MTGKLPMMSPFPLPTITEVRLTFIPPQQGLCALARVVLSDSLALDSIGVHQRLDGNGYRLTYPTKNGRTLYHPISKALSQAIEQAIFNELRNHLKSVSHDRYHHPML
jgi:stage V sporulation protein G